MYKSLRTKGRTTRKLIGGRGGGVGEVQKKDIRAREN